MNTTAPFGAAPIVSAAELRRNFGVWQERAMLTPVLVLRHGKPRLVLCGTEQFAGTGTAGPEARADGAIASIPEHTSEGLLVLDRDLNILAVNRVFEDNCGLHARQLVGASWPDVFPSAANSVIGAHFRQVLRTGQTSQFETPSTIHTGRHYLVTAFPHAEGVAALFVNQTTEVLMRESEAERLSLKAGFAKLDRALSLRLNLRGYIEGASPQFEALVGYPFRALGAPALSEIVSRASRPRVVQALETTLGGNDVDPLTAELVTGAGQTLPVELAMAPLWRGASPDGATVFVLRA